MTPSYMLLIMLLSIALYADLRTGKIPNMLTLPCMALAVTLCTITQGWVGLCNSLAGGMLILVLFLLLAPSTGIGGGDIKLMTAVATIVGIKLAVWSLLFSAIAGGVLSLIVMARYRVLLSTTRQMASNAYMSFLLRSPVDLTHESSRIKFRYSPAIAIGTLLAVLLTH